MGRALIAVAVIVAAGLGAGCFAPDLGNGAIACGEDDICPPDYYCHADRHCYQTPQSCPTAVACNGKDCGEMPDGCGGVATCGGACPSGQSCGGGGGGMRMANVHISSWPVVSRRHVNVDDIELPDCSARAAGNARSYASRSCGPEEASYALGGS